MSKRTRKRPRSRAETTRATHAALIAAGIAEFGEHGFDASLDAICARAKLTRGAFYVHFADRDAFIVAVMHHVLGTFVTALTTLAPTTRRGPEIDAALDLFFATASSNAPVIRGGAGLRFHHLLDACKRSKVIGDTYRKLVTTGRDQLAAMLGRDQRAGSLHVGISPAPLADLMVVLSLGVIAMLELELPIELAPLRDTVGTVLHG